MNYWQRAIFFKTYDFYEFRTQKKKKEKKLFQFLPLKNSYNLGFIKLETHGLSDALVNKNNMSKLISVRVGDKYIKVLKTFLFWC